MARNTKPFTNIEVLNAVACIEDQEIIDQILTHLCQKQQDTRIQPLLVPPTRAPLGTLPLFAGKELPLSQFNQQVRH